jgi:hypothetical protein
MSYTFKVGDKGKMSNGVGYEVVLVDHRLSMPVRFIVEGGDALCMSKQDGTRAQGLSTVWLNPPTRTVYVNFYEDGSCFYYNDELTAKIQVPFDERHRIATAVPVEIVG